MGSFSVWALPRRVQAAVLLVEVVAIVVVVLAQTSAEAPSQADLADALVLSAFAFSHTELALGVERLRLLVTRPLHVSLTSVWTFAAALHLPLVSAVGVAVVVQTHVWLRAERGHSPLYKHVFSTASVVLACAAAGAVGSAGVAADGGGGGLLVLLCATAVYAMVNGGLVAVVIALSTATRDLVTLLGDGDSNVLELATLTLGALVALVLPINPWLVGLVLPPVLVLHRAVLVRQLKMAAATDGKTGLLNAHTWSARAEHQLRRTVRNATPHAVLVLDLDHFKAVNDRHGHLTGDQVLAAVAGALRSEVRGRDLVGRFGGEEFVILLAGQKGGRETDLAAVAERIRQRVAALEIEVTTPRGSTRIDDLSISVGGALHPGGRADLPGLLRVADRALYSAKRAGRNQVRMSAAVSDGSAERA